MGLESRKLEREKEKEMVLRKLEIENERCKILNVHSPPSSRPSSLSQYTPDCCHRSMNVKWIDNFYTIRKSLKISNGWGNHRLWLRQTALKTQDAFSVSSIEQNSNYDLAKIKPTCLCEFGFRGLEV